MNWGIKTIGELCHIEKGKIGITKAIPGEFPLVVTSEERKSHNEYHFDAEAVVIPLVSSTGHGHKSLKRIHYQAGKFAVGNILCAVIPKDKSIINAEYLYHYLNLNREKELVSRMKGMANVSLPMKEIAKIEVPIPPLDEQKNFVEEYKLLEDSNSDLNNEIEIQLDLVKQLRQAFLREAMQGKLTAKWREENPDIEPASELLKKIKAEKEQLIKEKKIKKQKSLPPIKEDEIPFEIPKSWKWCRLGEICEINGGKRVPAGYKLLTKKTHYVYIRVSDMQNNTIIDTDLHYIEEDIFQKIRNYTISKNDIYMTIVGATIGKCGLVPDKFDGCNLTENAVKISPWLISKEFLFQVLNMPFAQTQFIDKTKKVGVEKMAIFRFKNTLLTLPPLIEQQQIVTKLDELMQYRDKLEENIKTSQQQNEKLLQQVLREALEPEKK